MALGCTILEGHWTILLVCNASPLIVTFMCDVSELVFVNFALLNDVENVLLNFANGTLTSASSFWVSVCGFAALVLVRMMQRCLDPLQHCSPQCEVVTVRR